MTELPEPRINVGESRLRAVFFLFKVENGVEEGRTGACDRDLHCFMTSQSERTRGHRFEPR